MSTDLTTDVLANPLLAPLVQHVRLKVAQAILGIGRSKLYEALGRGELTAVKDVGRTLVTTESILAYQERRPIARFTPPPPPRLEGLQRLKEIAAAKRAARARRKGAR